MIETKIDELFNTIKDSGEYKSYLNIGKILDNNQEIKDLVSTIKKLQQQSVNLEEQGNLLYKEVDKEINEKVSCLNSMPIYQEYLRRMNSFNDILAESKNNIEQFLNDKI